MMRVTTLEATLRAVRDENASLRGHDESDASQRLSYDSQSPMQLYTMSPEMRRSRRPFGIEGAADSVRECTPMTARRARTCSSAAA